MLDRISGWIVDPPRPVRTSLWATGICTAFGAVVSLPYLLGELQRARRPFGVLIDYAAWLLSGATAVFVLLLAAFAVDQLIEGRARRDAAARLEAKRARDAAERAARLAELARRLG
jgi:hypothetical protein